MLAVVEHYQHVAAAQQPHEAWERVFGNDADLECTRKGCRYQLLSARGAKSTTHMPSGSPGRTDDWGVPVDATISSFNDHPTKLMTMYAGGETIDVSQSSPFSFPNFIAQGLVEPLDGLPGADEYQKDFTDSAKQVAVFDGKLMGLPYFSTVWVWNYYTDLMDKAQFEPFKTYDELLEQCRKAKKDGICDYPIQWVAGVGLEQLPGTWYQLTWNRGGIFFDKAGNHQLGPGSIARETLKWWIQTFTEQLVDPESLKVLFTTSAKAFSGQEHLSRTQPPLRAQHRQ
jgi:ABC-type glycerol-3-phosphate transport system substrate-binding protein